jgi:hypothetical protein
MMDLGLLVAVVGGLVLAALLRLYYNHTEAGRRALAKYKLRNPMKPSTCSGHAVHSSERSGGRVGCTHRLCRFIDRSTYA